MKEEGHLEQKNIYLDKSFSAKEPYNLWLFCGKIPRVKKKSTWSKKMNTPEWQIPIGCHIFTGHFPQKSPTICGSFAEKHLQLEAIHGSSPPCISLAQKKID